MARSRNIVIGTAYDWLRFTPGRGLATLLVWQDDAQNAIRSASFRTRREVSIVGPKEDVYRVLLAYKNLVATFTKLPSNGFAVSPVDGGSGPKLVIGPPVETSDEDESLSASFA